MVKAYWLGARTSRRHLLGARQVLSYGMPLERSERVGDNAAGSDAVLMPGSEFFSLETAIAAVSDGHLPLGQIPD